MIKQDQRARTIGLISFVVPAWNEEAQLAGTLRCIREAARSLGERFEILVANDGSTDRTGQIAEQLADRTVHVHHRQIAAARNAGAQAARGDLLIFVDADTTVTDGLLRATLQAVRQGAVGGGCLARFDAPVPIWGWLATALANAYCRLFRVAYGCFLFCTREAFDAVGGCGILLKTATANPAIANVTRTGRTTDHRAMAGAWIRSRRRLSARRRRSAVSR